MTQKIVGYVELEWTCPNCGAKNAGALKTCAKCGAPQPQNVQFQQAEKQQALTDAQKIEQAKKGADIHCPYCGTRNAADAKVCVQCGGDLKEGAKHVSGTVVGAFVTQTGPVKQIPCPSCATPNPETNKTCSACGALMTKPQVAPKPPVPATPAKTGGTAFPAWMALPVLCILLVCFVAVGSLFFRTSSKTGAVDSVNWERTVAIEALQNVTREDWKSDLPQDAKVVSCQQKHRSDQDSPAPNAKEVCGTPYNKDLGNGYAETVQDCHYEVYEDYCKYTAKEWQSVDQAVAQGADLNPRWPKVTLGAGQREGSRKETYTAQFQTDDGVKEFTTDDAQLFSQLEPGSTWTLEINTFGAIVNVQQP